MDLFDAIDYKQPLGAGSLTIYLRADMQGDL